MPIYYYLIYSYLHAIVLHICVYRCTCMQGRRHTLYNTQLSLSVLRCQNNTNNRHKRTSIVMIRTRRLRAKVSSRPAISQRWRSRDGAWNRLQRRVHSEGERSEEKNRNSPENTFILLYVHIVYTYITSACEQW